MVAASYSDDGTVCKPASSVMAIKGTPRQILAKMTDQRAFQGSPKKSMLEAISPIFLSDHDRTENWLSNNHQKAIDDRTAGPMNGKRTSARMMSMNGMYAF